MIAALLYDNDKLVSVRPFETIEKAKDHIKWIRDNNKLVFDRIRFRDMGDDKLTIDQLRLDAKLIN